MIVLFLLLILSLVVCYLLANREQIKRAMKIYGASYKFVKKNKFYKSLAIGGYRIWNKRQLENIINFFDDSPRQVFIDQDIYLVLYENKNILFCKPFDFWQFIPYESLQDIRVSRRNMALKGAIQGRMIAGDIGAYMGADKREIAIHLITKGFETPNYDLEIKHWLNVDEVSNLLYYIYSK